MAERDSEFNWGGDRRGRGRGRNYGGRVYRSGDNQEDYGDRGSYRSGRLETYGDRGFGEDYERSRGREHLGENPRGREDRGGRAGYGSRERDMDAYSSGYGGRGGGYWGSESESDYDRGYGSEDRNPYYGGGGLFGGGLGGYTGGGYLGGGLGRSAMENESEEDRAYRRQNYRGGERYDTRRSYGRGGNREDYADRRSGRGEDRGFFDRVSDEVSSWFGGGDDDRDDTRERSFRGRGPRNYTRSDDRIKEDINDRLTYDYSIDASEIDVEVNSGEVVLSGTVRSRYEKRLAEDIAEDINGVNNVENRIRVNRESSSWGSSSTTSSTTTGTSGTTSEGSGLGAGSTGTSDTSGMTGSTTSAENTGTRTTGTGKARSAGGNR